MLSCLNPYVLPQVFIIVNIPLIFHVYYLEGEHHVFGVYAVDAAQIGFVELLGLDLVERFLHVMHALHQADDVDDQGDAYSD